MNYTYRDIFNSFVIYGEWNIIISRTCGVFNERYPNLHPYASARSAECSLQWIMKKQDVYPYKLHTVQFSKPNDAVGAEYCETQIKFKKTLNVEEDNLDEWSEAFEIKNI